MGREREQVGYDVVVVGAGFAGMDLLHKLRLKGFSVLVIEAGRDVGGTWYWNRYPGARCDVQSVDYQLSFPEDLQREWTWTERFASQPEIARYASFVADRLDLRRDIRFGQRVTGAQFDSDTSLWQIETDKDLRWRASFCVMATGCLSIARRPDIDGIDDFSGEVYHTGEWPVEGVDFTGKRVAVIGTGSSGVQSIPLIARQADHLYVLQRTPNFVFPAFNHPLDSEHVAASKEAFQENRRISLSNPTFSVANMGTVSALAVSDEEREREFEHQWLTGGGFGLLLAYSDLLIDRRANDLGGDFVRRKIREMVADDELAERLMPRGYPFGTKRICLGTDYYETFRRANVSLVDLLSNPIDGIAPQGIRCESSSCDVDAIVFATGFDAMTGALESIDIQGPRGGLKEKWTEGARTFIGMTVAGFPNLFLVTGPGSPSVLTNVVVAIEHDVGWIIDCLCYLRANEIDAIEALDEAEAEWVDHVQDVAAMTLYPHANSWYMGANIPGKRRLFLPYVGGATAYSDRCRAIADASYAAFRLTAKSRPARAS